MKINLSVCLQPGHTSQSYVLSSFLFFPNFINFKPTREKFLIAFSLEDYDLTSAFTRNKPLSFFRSVEERANL